MVITPLTFLLTRPSRGVTQLIRQLVLSFFISTHTPLAGRDLHGRRHARHDGFLLTRPSRGVTRRNKKTAQFYIFLLTRPSRGVTEITACSGKEGKFLLTRPSRGVTDADEHESAAEGISTHTPLAGRD